MSAPTVATEPRELHARALELHAERRTDEAIAVMRAAVRACLDTELLNDLGVMLDAAGDTGAAELLLRACLAVDPGDTLAAENLARMRPAPCILEAGPGFAHRLSALTGVDAATLERALLRPGPPVAVPVLALGGAPFRLRPGTTDVRQFEDSFLRHWHLPPFALDEPRLIVDLGANIGTTMAHYAQLYPSARVIGVELDEENAALCRENVERYGERCQVVQAALAAHDGVARYRRGAGDEWGYSIVDGEGDVTAEAISLDTLLERLAPGERVDYLKMDIEGAERDVLRTGGAWVRRVACLNLEPHPPYTPEAARADLEALGFEVMPALREGCFVAVSPSAA